MTAVKPKEKSVRLWAVVFWLVYNILGNVPFILIQRYNRPRLVLLEQRRKRRAAKQ